MTLLKNKSYQYFLHCTANKSKRSPKLSPSPKHHNVQNDCSSLTGTESPAKHVCITLNQNKFKKPFQLLRERGRTRASILFLSGGGGGGVYLLIQTLLSSDAQAEVQLGLVDGGIPRVPNLGTLSPDKTGKGRKRITQSWCNCLSEDFPLAIHSVKYTVCFIFWRIYEGNKHQIICKGLY